MSEDVRPITAQSSIGDWLDHPTGGPLLREMLSAAGQDASALAPVHGLPLQRLVEMSQGQMPQSIVDDLVLRANGGVMPEADAAAVSAGWSERVTAGRFDGRTVIVTGAGSGIGRATASRIVREGGRVVGVDVSADRLAEVAGELGGGFAAITADITSEEGVAAILAAAGGRVDGLANVAGIMDDMSALHEVTDALWDRVIAVNVTGMMRLTRAVLPLMIEAGSGSIVNIASEAGLRGSAAGAAYTASKHAVVGLTKNSAFMYGPKGIRVNAVAPGPVLTNIRGAGFREGEYQGRINSAMTILPPIAEPAQLAASITFLLSDDGTNVNGAILPSDGGWSAV